MIKEFIPYQEALDAVKVNRNNVVDSLLNT